MRMMRISVLLGLISAACGQIDPAPEVRSEGLTILGIDALTGIDAVYRKGSIEVRLSSRVDGNVVNSRIDLADGTPLTKLALPTGSVFTTRAVMPDLLRSGTVASRQALDAAKEMLRANPAIRQAVHAATRELSEHTSELGYTTLRMGLLYSSEILAAYDFTQLDRLDLGALSPNEAMHDALAPCHEVEADHRLPFHSIAQHFGDLPALDAKGGASFKDSKGKHNFWFLCYAICWIHDAVCAECNYGILCGPDCMPGAGCWGRCGGGCGDEGPSCQTTCASLVGDCGNDDGCGGTCPCPEPGPSNEQQAKRH